MTFPAPAVRAVHGFKDGKDATCPAASADKHRDGIVDLHCPTPG